MLNQPKLPKMNATSLYVSTCRLILQANAEDSASWTDLFRLVPYLRQSLSCTVCGSLLVEPHTPTETNCQHHVCKSCKGGRKKLKPACSWCKDYDKYVENVQLRILLQCYKKLCEYMTSTSIYKKLGSGNVTANSTNTNQHDGTPPTLISLIQEGAGFADEFRNSVSSRPSNFNYSGVNTITTSTQTNSGPLSTALQEDSFQAEALSADSVVKLEGSEVIPNGSSTYSVTYIGSGNKLTIKRKASEPALGNSKKSFKDNETTVKTKTILSGQSNASNFPTPTTKKSSRGGKASLSGSAVKTGCRCGNATATPGKLTCCGQRCACYTESKPCIDCKCRGCRNPHTADGQKVCPYQLQLSSDEAHHLTGPQSITLSPNDMVTATGGTVQVVGVYTTQLHSVTSPPVLLDANTQVTTCNPEDEVLLGI